jgi:hypothetical protein
VTRARFAVAAVLAVVLVGGGIAMERSLGVRGTAIARVPIPKGSSGAWFCPHGGGEARATWVVIANPSQRPTELSLTSAGGAPETESAVLEPRTHRYVRVEAEDPSAGTVVEFFGGEATAAMVASRPDGGLAAEPCTDRATDRWYLADGTAEVEGEGVGLVVMNPTSVDAVVDIVVSTERENVRPGPLQGVVLPPGRVKAFDLNRFALGAATVGARVTAAVGRVSVAGFGSSEGGLRATIGTPDLQSRWYLPGAGDGARSELVIEASGAEVPFQARAQGPEGQVPALEQATVRGGGIRTFIVATEGGALLAEAEGPVGFVAARRSSFAGTGVAAPEEPVPTETPSPPATPSPSPTETASPSPTPMPTPTPKRSPRRDRRRDRRGREEQPSGEAVDRAATSGSPVAATGWVVVPATGPQGGRSILQIQNPGAGPVTAAVTLFGAEGPVGADGLDAVNVPAGRSVSIRLDDITPDPVTAVVRASGGVVAAQIAVDPRAYAFSLGSPASSVLTGSSSGIILGP